MAAIAPAEVARAHVRVTDAVAAAEVTTTHVGVRDAAGMPAADHVAAAHIRMADDAGVRADATAVKAANSMTAGEATPVVPAPMDGATPATEMPAPASAVESASAATRMTASAVPAASATGKRSAGKDGERERRNERENLRLGAHADQRPRTLT
jgi:hypothetical protein